MLPTLLSLPLDRGRPWLIVAEAAGGGNILSHFVRELINMDSADLHFLLNDPATEFFSRFPFWEDVDSARKHRVGSFDLSAHEFGCVLLGTSTAMGCLEGDILDSAKEVGLKTISVLDHWVNYRERFGYPRPDWRERLPDYVLCPGADSLNLALNLGFSESGLRQVVNPHIQWLKQYGHSSERVEGEILYICSPLAQSSKLAGETSRKYGFTEAEALVLFLDALREISGSWTRVILRLHPLEARTKYDEILREHKIGERVEVTLSNDEAVEDALLRASLVVGTDSSILAVSLELGVKTLSCIPGAAHQCSLPHESLIRWCGETEQNLPELLESVLQEVTQDS